MIDDMPRPDYYMKSQIEDAVHVETKKAVLSLKLRTKALPLITATYARRLLVSSGKYVYRGREYAFPPCIKGNRCVGKTLCVGKSEFGCDRVRGMPRDGFICMMLMYPHEYDHFVKTGTAPSERRECLLCFRRMYSVLSMQLRKHPMLCVSSNECLMCFREPIDTKNGYFRQYAILPLRGRYIGFFDPIIDFRTLLLTASRMTSGQWQINQDAMLFRTADRRVRTPQSSILDF